MTITAERAVAALVPTRPADDPPTCEHFRCPSGEPTKPAPLFPGGPLRPASWGGAGAGLADLDGPRCPAGLDFCCGRCGCRGE